jgi:hypothetical protein
VKKRRGEEGVARVKGVDQVPLPGSVRSLSHVHRCATERPHGRLQHGSHVHPREHCAKHMSFKKG